MSLPRERKTTVVAAVLCGSVFQFLQGEGNTGAYLTSIQQQHEGWVPSEATSPPWGACLVIHVSAQEGLLLLPLMEPRPSDTAIPGSVPATTSFLCSYLSPSAGNRPGGAAAARVLRAFLRLRHLGCCFPSLPVQRGSWRSWAGSAGSRRKTTCHQLHLHVSLGPLMS